MNITPPQSTQKMSFSIKDRTSLDVAVSITPYLIYKIEQSLKPLLKHLRMRRKRAHRIHVQLFCEDGESFYQIEVHPEVPHCSVDSFVLLVENKLNEIEFSSPVRDIVVEVIPFDRDVHRNRSQRAFATYSKEEHFSYTDDLPVPMENESKLHSLKYLLSS